MTYVVALYLSQSSESSMLNLTYLTPQRCLGGACGRLSGLDDRPRHLHTHRPLMPPQVHLMIMLKRIMWEFHTYCSICRYIRFRNSGCWFYFVLCRETRRFSKRLQRAGGRDEVSFENQNLARKPQLIRMVQVAGMEELDSMLAQFVAQRLGKVRYNQRRRHPVL